MNMNSDMLKEYAKEYLTLRGQKQQLETRMKELSELLKSGATDYGVKNSTGSSYCEYDEVIVGSMAKKSVRLNEDKAIKFFKGKKLYKQVVETKEYISEEKIEQLLANSVITEEDVQSFMDVKTTYSLDVKKVEKEEAPEVEVSKLKMKKKINKKK